MYVVKYTHQYQLWNEVDGSIKCIICDGRPVYDRYEWVFIQHRYLGIRKSAERQLYWEPWHVDSNVRVELEYDSQW